MLTCLVACLSPYVFFCLSLSGKFPSRPGGLFIGRKTTSRWRKLPARFARLACMTAIVIAPATAAAKALAAAFWPVSLGLGFVDGQRSSAQIGSVQGRDGLIGLAGIRHLHKTETAGAACLPVRYEGDFFHSAVRLKSIS